MSSPSTRRQELHLSAALVALLVVEASAYFAVRLTKESYARAASQPGLTALDPPAVFPGARQRVSVVGERTHFGPWTTVEAKDPWTIVSDVGFASESELWFHVRVEDALSGGEGAEIPLAIRSPLADGGEERIELTLRQTLVPRPFVFELANLEAGAELSTTRDFVLVGWKAEGYAPYTVRVKQIETGSEWERTTEQTFDQLGVPLEERFNPLELILRDAVGREAVEHVYVRREGALGGEVTLAALNGNAALTGYSGDPVDWAGDSPTEQSPASDCSMGNGIETCSDCCEDSESIRGGEIAPPPNDYPRTLGPKQASAWTEL